MPEKVCGAVHPAGVVCAIPARNPNHETHFANVGGEQYFWENPSFVEPQDKPSQAMRQIISGHMDSLAAGIRKGASSPPAESEPDESSVDDNYVTMPSEPTQTQEWAGDKVLPAAGTQRRQIYDTYLEYPDGLADEEMEAITGLLMNSIRPRRNELMEQGLVVETGRLRPNRNGNPENVYVASRFAPEGSSESPRPLIAFE